MEATLEAQTRDTFGKNEARRTRRSGRVPAVVYGAGDGREARGDGDLGRSEALLQDPAFGVRREHA
jgi:hypothetical protein